MLGIFFIAFFMKRVGGTAAFWATLTGQAVTFAVAAFTSIAYLWYNVIGALVVIAAAWVFNLARPKEAS